MEMSQVRKEMELRFEDSTDEGILKLNTTTVALPSEMLTYLLEMHCKNSELAELKKLRLVSRAWRDALEKLWRKRVTVCLIPFSMKQFRRIVKEPSFNFKNCPLQKFQITQALFTENESDYCEDTAEFWNVCGTSIKHLELRLPKIGSCHKLLEIIFLKLLNMEKFCLFAPEYVSSEGSTQDAGTLATIKRKKLFYLKLDLSERFANSYYDVKEFPFPLTWYQFLASFPNLQQLEILGEGDASIRYRQCVQAVKTLSLEGGLQHLNHLKIWDDDFLCRKGSSYSKCAQDICQSNLPALDSLHIEFRLPHGAQEGLASERVLEKFGSNLKRLCLRLPVHYSKIFPFGQRLEKLEHLSVSWDMAHFIRNAKYLPNLKSFSVSSITGDVSRPFSSIIWQDNINKVTESEPQPTQENAFETELPPQIHNYDGFSEDEEVDEEDEDFEMQYIPRAARGFLFEGYKCIRGNFTFVNVTFLRLEWWFSCQVFKKLPKWMPNVTTLEALMTACTFPVVCDKWRNLEKFTLLQFMGDQYKSRMSIKEDFVPVDDCAIVGKKHLTTANYHCSFDNAHNIPTQSPGTSEEDGSIIPNISYLTHLKYFKMQMGQITLGNIGKDFQLSDASALHGFYKLPHLEHLEIVAVLKPETIQELFKRVPRCILYQSYFRSESKYYGWRNCI